MNAHERQLRERADEVRERLDGLVADLRTVDAEVESLAGRRTQHELLEQACASLEKLGELGAADLFWGDRIEATQVAERLRVVRGRVDAFQQELDALDERRRGIAERIGSEEEILAVLDDDLDEIREQEERKKQDWIVEREVSAVPARFQRLAWTRGGVEDRRFRKILGWTAAASALLGLLLPLIDLPLPTRFVPEDVPRRLAQLVREERARPVPPPVLETPADETKPEPIDETQPQDPTETPEIAEAQPPADAPPAPVDAAPGPAGPEGPSRKAVQKAGILAFRDKFASLPADDPAPRPGASARLRDADDAARGVTRNMLTTNAPGSSGGIDLASLSRNVGGGGGAGGDGVGGGIQGVPVGRATSSIASIGGGGGGRPLAGGGHGASRTDEEIQIVFDRYKSAFYRMYNRQLRNDPTLRGQMVLRLTIEPDGSVSMCELDSTDMNAPTLVSQVVDRVRTIDFGAKEGVEALTIVYPIDFLPAA